MFSGIALKIKNLRQKDDSTKKRFLIIFSGLSIGFLIFIWAVYLKISLPKLTEEKSAAAKEKTSAVLGRGGKIVLSELEKEFGKFKEGLEGGISAAKRKLQSFNEFSVKVKSD